MSSRRARPKRYPLRNFRLCDRLQRELRDVAIRKISNDIQTMLLASKDKQFVQARNQMDIPYGLFGLKLKDFYERRKRDTLYLDVLQLVCQTSLEQAKTCIVLDDFLELIRNLFEAYRSHNMKSIQQEIADSHKLLTINEVIAAEYRDNKTLLRLAARMMDELYANKKAHFHRLKIDMEAAENYYMESIMVINTLEFRTYVNYNKKAACQYMHELSTAEEGLQSTLDSLQLSHRIEEEASGASVMRQSIEIHNLRKKIAEMSLLYDDQSDFYDGEIAYHSNMVEVMKSRYKECMEKLPFFAVEMVKLRQWEADLAQKARDEAMALITAKPKKRKKIQKQKDTKGVVARRR